MHSASLGGVELLLELGGNGTERQKLFCVTREGSHEKGGLDSEQALRSRYRGPMDGRLSGWNVPLFYNLV